MIEITESTAAEYLRASGRIAADEVAETRELSGGVSNVVLLVSLPGRGERFVLKQARGQLRVKEEWLCPVERIWREVDVLRACGELLPSAKLTPSKPPALFAANVPDLLWEDRDNYCFAMAAAPARNRTWKELLLAGRTVLSQFVAFAAGRLLGTLHAGTWRSAAALARFEDRSFFDRLRLDPYYRFTASIHPDLAPQLARLVDSVWSHRLCLVHGDFSPKNLLVWPPQVMLIDFEVGHYGDPAFDLGFFLTHLVAKAIRAREKCRHYLLLVEIFWQEYRRQVSRVATAAEMSGLRERMLLNLAGCLLARVDGKSPLEYLSSQERQVIRQLGREWLIAPPDSLTGNDELS